MSISHFLARVIGLYWVIISLVMFIRPTEVSVMVLSLIHNLPLMFVTGCFTLIIGLMMIVGHNIWELSWRVLVTLVGWLVFIKALSILFFPHLLDRTTIALMENITATYTAAGFDLFLGLLFIYFSFKKP